MNESDPADKPPKQRAPLGDMKLTVRLDTSELDKSVLALIDRFERALKAFRDAWNDTK